MTEKKINELLKEYRDFLITLFPNRVDKLNWGELAYSHVEYKGEKFPSVEEFEIIEDWENVSQYSKEELKDILEKGLTENYWDFFQECEHFGEVPNLYKFIATKNIGFDEIDRYADAFYDVYFANIKQDYNLDKLVDSLLVELKDN